MLPTAIEHYRTRTMLPIRRFAERSQQPKTILQSPVKGKRRKSRQKKCEDNIKERTGMDFASSTKAAENRTRWKGIVAKSCAPTTFQCYGIE